MSTGARLTAGGICAVVAIALLPSMASAVFQGRNGEIAFVSGRDGGDASSDVYIIDGPADTTPTPLTTAAGQHRHPNWSPDGARIAYALFDGAANEDIWVHDVGGGRINLTQTGTVRDDRPAFSPDGTRVAYESEVADGSGQQDILITTLGPGGGTVNLTSSPNATEGKPVWSPDGSTIFYSFVTPANGSDHDIYSEPADNSSMFGSFVINSATAEYQPSLSPDGSEFCYTRGPFGSNQADVFAVNISGSNAPGVDISDNHHQDYPNQADPLAGDYNCVYSPDGRTILYVKGTFGNGGLVFKNADDTGSVVPYGNNVAMVFDGNPDWARVPDSCKGQQATLYGTDGPDTLTGTPGRDVVVAYGGNDTIVVGAAGDVVCAGKGKDGVRGKPGRDQLFGGPGKDTLRGGKGKDTLRGGPDNDLLNGGGDRDLCVGGPGRDNAINCEKERSL